RDRAWIGGFPRSAVLGSSSRGSIRSWRQRPGDRQRGHLAELRRVGLGHQPSFNWNARAQDRGAYTRLQARPRSVVGGRSVRAAQSERNSMKPSHPIVRNLVLALGLAAAGWFIGHGFVRARMATRFVSVKGISEREVRAGLAIWPLKIIIADNDLGRAHGNLATDIREIQGL